MIKIENFEVLGWEHAVRGMRNPMNSWAKSDSAFKEEAHTTILDENDKPKDQIVHFDALAIGENDHDLMERLVKGGPVHAKFRRMITVYVDITAPLYWWKEFDTYKVGTVANSCSTMHKIHEKEFTIDDFSHEYLDTGFKDSPVKLDEDACISTKCGDPYDDYNIESYYLLEMVVELLNVHRTKFLETKNKDYWWQMIQLLPSSYNQKRTVMLNYEVLANIYEWRKNHKLDEWRTFCEWIETLPYSEIITRSASKTNTDVLYICDRKQCKDCDDMAIDCHHTTDINHAVNFEKLERGYWEKKNYPWNPGVDYGCPHGIGTEEE